MTGSRAADGADVVVVGAGIVGLGVALAAIDDGRSVLVVERDERAVGASIRNFGHICTTVQAGIALQYARVARETWLRVARESGAWLREAGTVIVARADDELAVLSEFATERGPVQVQPLTAAQVARRTGLAASHGGAWLPQDLRVDARTALPAITAWLGRRGVRFAWRTAVSEVQTGLVRTSRGKISAGRVFVAVGHHLGLLLPDLADAAGLRQCALHMINIDSPGGRRIEPAIFTGYSLLRYGGFASCAGTATVRARLSAEHPRAVAAGLNLMFTQRPDGTLILGDTHAYARTHPPFQDEDADRLLLGEAAELLGVESLSVRQRWRGVYAAAAQQYLVAEPQPGLHVLSVTSGIGMTTAFGLAATVYADGVGGNPLRCQPEV